MQTSVNPNGTRHVTSHHMTRQKKYGNRSLTASGLFDPADPGFFSGRVNFLAGETYYGSHNPNFNANYNYNYNYNNISHHQNNNSNINSNVRTTNRKPVVRHERPDQRRHQRAQSEPSVSRRSVYDDNSAAKRSSSDDSMKVSILRRGESLDSKIKSSGAADAGRLGPAAMYAGSGFAVSPAPSSLPLPSFSKKKQTSIDDSATRDIKRLLRLDL
ncbi:hypothetical protein Dsin_029412 [Dipteronia sinensis]|uniref:Uncharacterized protein n=1 Tax=Dipteronia sinensis TaxID=43782 RepID=A0AAE0DVG6_9ROSI|nr:hypothetical protein Dsin_029412 [Dipteronia sinensis]